MRQKQNIELTSEKYGNFFIEVISPKGKCVIWWDYLDEQDGFMMEPDEQIEAALDLFEDCDVRDFSDLPEDGEFKNTDEAIKYLESKFGEKLEK
jgi:hypothetical protein